MISIHTFAEYVLARAGVPALSIDPSGSRKTHYFRDDAVVEDVGTLSFAVVLEYGGRRLSTMGSV